MPSHLLWTAVAMIALPLVVFFGGGAAMQRASHRLDLSQHAGSAQDPRPLFSRLGGYDRAAVEDYWGGLEKVGGRKTLDAERRFLELDLIFPFLYGGALAASLLLGWAALGRPFNPGWIIAPVTIGVLADWTENLIQLQQLGRFMAAGGAALADGCIRIASVGTTLKIGVLLGTSLCAVVLGLLVVVRAFKS
jgi:hypothetical protein